MRLSRKVPFLLVAVVVAMGLAFATWLHLAMTHLTDASARASALTQLDVARSAMDSAAALPDYALLDDPSTPPQLMAAARRGERATWVTTPDEDAWAAMRTRDGYVLAVHVPWHDESRLVDRLDTYLVAGILGTTLVTAGLALWVGVTLARRLGAAETAARAIADGDLDVRVRDVVQGADEVTLLATTIDQLAATMQERIALEQRVTADIAHDLRTPVTGLVTAAQLLPEGRATTLVRSQVDRLRRLVEDLLEVAHLDRAEQHLDIVATSTSTLATAAAAAVSREVPVRVVRDGLVTTDPRRVQRVIVNLVENALRHGGEPVEIIVDGPTLTVRDHGPGYDEEFLREGPQRFRTGAADRGSGHGLGLTIAAGQARALGGTLVFSNASDGGARARLILP